MKKTPERIWLREDDEDSDCIIWDGNPNGDDEVEYVRADQEVDFPILRIVNEYLNRGGRIERQHGRTCLVDKDGEYLAGGDDLKGLFVNAVFTFC